MEEILYKNIYLLDLSNIEYIPEIIYKLSSVLEQEEIHDKQIHLKLGNVNLNEAQLLSIKSLISGFGSSLYSLDTKSPFTEQAAGSLGIKIVDTPQLQAEIIKETVDKIAETDNSTETAADDKTETDTDTAEDKCSDVPSPENYNVENTKTEITDVQNNEQPNVEIPPQIEMQNDETIQSSPEFEQKIEEEQLMSVLQNSDTPENNGDIYDELDVIFNSNSIPSNVFNVKSSEKYAEREELTDIVVPKDEYTKEDIEIENFPTKYIKQTIRSGQVINYEGNIIIIGDCHPGSEVNAFGDITVWGVLSGIAHAGARGNEKARVRALKMNAIQLRIADCYSRRPDSLNTIFFEKTNSFTPEEARIISGEIVVFKIND